MDTRKNLETAIDLLMRAQEHRVSEKPIDLYINVRMAIVELNKIQEHSEAVVLPELLD